MLHNNSQVAWEGAQPFRAGDVLELSLDLDQGTLHAAKNGTELGLLCEGLSGVLRWSAELSEDGDSVMLEALPVDGSSAWQP